MIQIKVRVFPLLAAASFCETYTVPESTTFETVRNTILKTRNVKAVELDSVTYPKTK